MDIAAIRRVPAVRRFLRTVAILRDGDRQSAFEAYRKQLEVADDEKEMLIFRTRQLFVPEKEEFIRFNNRVVEEEFSDRKPSRILALLPFCLQNTKCPHRITWNIKNCRMCGQCSICEIRKICEQSGIEIRVAIRSIFAPRFIREVNPELTIAVACEDELLAGILRAAPYLCYGVLNERPEGYCINTRVSAELLADAVAKFAKKEETRSATFSNG